MQVHTETSRPGNVATERVFKVLSAFRDGRQDHSIVSLSTKLKMTKSMVRRALQTLAQQNYVVRDNDSETFRLSPYLIELSMQFARNPTILDISLPFIRRLLSIANETVTLSVPAGNQSVIVSGMESEHEIFRRLAIGRVLPLHVTSAGRAILAFLPPDEIARYLGGRLQRFTQTTITDPERLFQEISLIRDKGYALGFEDYYPGTDTIAFPIIDSEGFAHGSLSIVGPRERLSPDRIAALLPRLQELMDQLNRHSRLFRAQNVGAQL